MTSSSRLGAVAAFLRRPPVQDALLAVVVAYLSVVALWNPPPFVTVDFTEPDATGVVLAIAGGVAVGFRSIRPVEATLAALAAVATLTHLGYSTSIGGIATLLALYSVAVGRSWRVSVPVTTLVGAGVGVALWTGPLPTTTSDWLSNMFVVSAAWVFGRSVRVRRAHAATAVARDRAEADAATAETRALVVEERARVAREMQDLVAHTLTEINVQVAAARRTMGHGDTSAAEQLLLDAEASGRAAMDEIRRAVGVLGHDEDDAARRPQPGLDELHDLLARERAAGGVAELTTTGTPVAVPAGIALTSYRLVEAALTDARCEGPHGADVQIVWTDTALTVVVRTAPKPPRVRWQEDLRSGGAAERLRTRVELYGGDLRRARTRDGGVEVTARFPVAIGRTA